ncbi:hypothetical protein SAMN05444274_1301 [Mariniphaga anaerophila]|uniref:Lipoprotein n=1 Tax=Mariniphaga anaerophila TaxID=1484053 RepID=A0A1M5GQ22_9BACT|nr:hypothetical protein [Mariniphaga anaerophila]SHG05855.1 hypothetical protein SAMN05444274_1301 [Mariniphaga anaerophila]
MKTKLKFLPITVIAVLLTSCASTSFYQVYKAVPTDKSIKTDNYLIYEDDNCKVSYDFWGEGGNIGFYFYNKTNENIYLNLEQSFFVLNGIAFDYYKNRVYTHSTSSGASSVKATTASKSVTGLNYLDLLQTNRIQASNSVGGMTSSGFSISYNEEKVICIPSKTSKVITEYDINESLYRDCDLFKYPTKKQIKSKSFTKSESPITFSNRITYTVGLSNKLIQFENEFYISEISNYPESEMFESKYDEYCGQKSTIMTKYFKNVSPDKFYIKYTKGMDTWKH